jgi:S-(hydroxymethyl)glutathione dehydrogenase / alcohol dehydrogenase
MALTTKAAILFDASTPLELHDVELEGPGPGDVLIRFLATGLCHSDLNILDGKLPHKFPVVLGHEGIADVVAVGDGVTDFKAGDRVIPFLVPDCGTCFYCKSGRTNFCERYTDLSRAPRSPFRFRGQPVFAYFGIGSFAQMSVVQANMLTKVNPAARVDHACCIGCGVATGLGAAMIAAKVMPGSSVAVFGCGGIGLSVIQGAKLSGATQIIAVDMNSAKEAVARKMGATDFVNPGVVENVPRHIIELTGRGADFAFECVGIPAVAQQALESTNIVWGVAMNIGLMKPGDLISTLPGQLMRGRKWTGTMMGGAKRQDVARFVDMYVNGDYQLDDLVSHHVSHENINHGFDMMRSGEAVRSVIVY